MTREHRVMGHPDTGSLSHRAETDGTYDYIVGLLGQASPSGGIDLIGSSAPLPVNLSGMGDSDMFGRLRVSNPDTLFDCKQLHNKAPLLFDEELYGTAASAHSVADARTRISTAANGDGAIRQTFQRFNYQPGKSQLAFLTFLATQEANARKRVGLLHTSNAADSVPQNGIYLEVNGTTDVAWCIAKNGVVTERVVQADWNSDTFDGSGHSGITLDLDATQIAFITFEWLGVGTVAVGFVVDGAIITAHRFNHANSGFSAVYMSTPNLPVSYSIYQDGAGTGSLDHICSTVISEGGSQLRGIPRSINTGFASAITFATVNTRYLGIAIRLKSGHEDAGVFFEQFSALANSNDNFAVRVVYDATLSGGSWTSAGADSAVEYVLGDGSITVSGGTVARCDLVSSQDRSVGTDANESLRGGTYIDGTRQVVAIELIPLTSNVGGYIAAKWRESP